MEPMTATGSVGNQDWYVARGAEGGPLICVDVDVVGGVVQVVVVTYVSNGVRIGYNIICQMVAGGECQGLV